MKRVSGLPLLSLLLLYFQASAQISIYQTRKMDLIYPGQGIKYLVPHTGKCFENAFGFHEKFWNYKSMEPITILFNDFSDIGNGGARVAPWNFINIAVSPFDYTFDVLPANERMQWLMSHENTHIVMCDKAAGSDIVNRKILGGKILTDQENPLTMLYSYLTMPRWYSPRWYHEGIAIFMETWMSGGMGRVMGSYDEMVFRTMVRDSAYFYRPIGLETEGTAIDFQVGVNAYLYGTRFDAYLALKHGTNKLRDFYSRSDSSKRFFARQFKKVYNASLSDEWESWIKTEQQHQQKNLEKIRQFPVTQVKKITPFAMGSISKMYVDKKERKIYAAVNYPKKLAHICSINLDNGEMEKIARVSSPGLYYVTNIAFDDSSQTLFVSDKNHHWRGLRAVDLKTGKSQKLIKFLRAGDLAFNKKDHCLYGIQHFNGRASIIRLIPPYKTYNTIYNIAFGYSLFNLDASPDGQFLSATLADMNGKQKLVLFNLKDLIAGKSEYSELYEFEDNTASNFVFTSDSKSLIGTSYYTGVSNVYRVNIASKNFELLTNAETGLFRPVEIGKDSLLVLEYKQDGLQPGLITVKPLEDANAIDYLGQKVFDKNTELESWMLPKLSKVNIDTLVTYEGKYNSFRHLKLNAAYPVILGYKNDVSVGYHFSIMDLLGYNALKLQVSYSPNLVYSDSSDLTTGSLPEKQKLHASFDYTYINFGLSGNLNSANFYDLFGPTKFSRAGYSLTASYKKSVNFYAPWNYGYGFSVSGYWDLERLPGFQNIPATEKTLYTTMARGSLSYLRKSLGATDYEQGFDWKVWIQGNYVAEQFFPSMFSTFDLGFLMPWKNSSFWIKTAVGQGFAERMNPFSNFYFGSFGYNYIDTKSGNRQLNRDIWGFPGLDIDEVGGKNFTRLRLETNLSPIRFKKLGFLWGYITYVRLNLFGSGLITNFDVYDDKMYSRQALNSGAQLDMELVLFSLLKSTLSAGFARAYRQDMKPSDEFMISLRLL
ncbi:MAG: YncE family protein [Bacteroidales bacterium]